MFSLYLWYIHGYEICEVITKFKIKQTFRCLGVETQKLQLSPCLIFCKFAFYCWPKFHCLVRINHHPPQKNPTKCLWRVEELSFLVAAHFLSFFLWQSLSLVEMGFEFEGMPIHQTQRKLDSYVNKLPYSIWSDAILSPDCWYELEKVCDIFIDVSKLKDASRTTVLLT